MQIRIGIGIPGNGNAVAAFQPTSISGNMLWLDVRSGITIGGTPLASGTSPPVVTLTGTLNQSQPVLLDIVGAGTLGVATVRWTFDMVNYTAPVPTAATVPIGSTGITANFPAGSYSADNAYQTTVASWLDRSSAANLLVQGTASLQPLLSYDSSIGICVLASGNQRLVCATGGVTGTAAHSIFGKLNWQDAGPTGGAGFCSVGGSAGQTSALGSLGAGYVTWYGGSGLGSGTGSNPATGTVLRMGKTRAAAGNTTGYLNGAVDMVPTSLAFNLSAGFVVGSFFDGGGASFPSPFSQVIAYSKELNGAEIAALDAFLASV